MKIGLYSITYLGGWYRGEALTLPELIRTAKKFGYDGVEIDGKRPHGNPLDWPKARCQELQRLAVGEGIEIGYHGYIIYELCHQLPVVKGETVGIEFAHKNAQLAAEFMREIIKAEYSKQPAKSVAPQLVG